MSFELEIYLSNSLVLSSLIFSSEDLVRLLGVLIEVAEERVYIEGDGLKGINYALHRIQL